jgi:hypothetical protein
VFNSRDYIYKPIPNPGGSKQDFFGGRDEEYKRHKESLERQIAHIQENLRVSNKTVEVLKVELNPSALAKSHRPMNVLFPSHKSPHIGGLNIGTLLFQITPQSLSWLKNKISESELGSNLVYDKQKRKMDYKPSSARSETGALDNLSLFSAEEKLQFTADKAIEWFRSENVSKGYLLEFIEYEQMDTPRYSISNQQIEKLKQDLVSNLYQLGSGIVLSKASNDEANASYYTVRVFIGNTQESIIDFDNTVKINDRTTDNYDFSITRHELLLKVLVGSSLIKNIALPPMASRVESSKKTLPHRPVFPERAPGDDYPVVGLIDSGIRNSALHQWVIGKSKGFSESDCDPDHGSQVASLLIGGNSLNPDLKSVEDDGCLIYDIWVPVHSERDSFFSNFDGFGEFFDWLDIEVRQARKKGVRIFNFSINFKELVKNDSYSFAASQIDRISKKHDVLFVLSAGNLGQLDYRAKWPSLLAITSDIDRIQLPSEAISAVTVGAINSPGSATHLHGAPTVYSRRGPGVGMGVKPDIVHYGGFSFDEGNPGVLTLNAANDVMNEGGTSFSAPFVAKILAAIEYKLNKNVSRNALIAMLMHHSNFPSVLNDKTIADSIKRRFIGFGLPDTSEDMLVTDDHTITILFEGKLKRSEVAEFQFQWPNSLVTNGKCTGEATLTLAYDPVTNPKFGAEYCRVNIDSFLQQETLEKGEWKFRKNCDFIWKTEVGKDAYYEKNQIEHGLKWWPVKKYKKLMKRGVGKSGNWRLKVSSTEREFGDFPDDGINFCAIVTIKDHKKVSTRIFDEMTQSLNATGAILKAIQVTSKVEIGVKK